MPSAAADAGKAAATPLIPPNPVTQTQADEAPAPTTALNKEEHPPVAKEDASSKLNAVDKFAQPPDKQTDQVLAPVSQPPPAEPTTTTAPAPSDAEAKLSPKPVSVEEVRDEELTAANPPAVANAPKLDIAPETAKTSETVSGGTDTSNAGSAKADPNAGDKRKADDVAAIEPVATGTTLNGTAGDEPAVKKQKPNGSNEAIANSGENGGAAPKRSRSKKEKKPAAPVGRTNRKTRSQGAAELS